MRRAWRIGAWTLGSALAVIVAVGAGVLIVGNTAAGRAWLEHEIVRFSDGKLQLTGLSGTFPAAIDIGELRLSDDRGAWLTAQRISLRWSPLALLARHVKVDSLQLARLDIERRPVSQPSKKSPSQESWAHLPVLDVRQLSIDTLELGPQLAGVRATLSLQATAHLISPSDATASISARRTNGQGSYQIRLRFDPSRMDATVALEEPAGGTLESLLQLPGLGPLSVEGSLNGPRAAEQLQLTARAGKLHALAQGSLDLAREAADLTYRLDAPDMAPRPGLSWQRLTLTGRWRGTITAPQADARLEIDRLQVPGGAGLARLGANLSAARGALGVQATAEGLVLPGPQPRLLASSPLRLTATMRLSDASRPLRLTAEHRLFSLQAQAVTTGALRGGFALRLPDLAPLAAIAGQKVRGKSELKGTLQQSSAGTRLDLDADTELASGATLLTSMLAGTSHLKLVADLTERTLEIERLTLNGRNVSVSASGSARRAADAHMLESLRARYEVGVANLAVISPKLGGTLKLQGQVDGPLNSLASQAQLTSSLSIQGAPPGTIEAAITARGLPALAGATLRAQGRLGGAPLQLDASLDRVAGDSFHLTVRRADWQSAHVEGDLTTAANATPGRGFLRLRMERLEDLQPLLGTSVKGSISGSLELKPMAGRTDLELRLAGRDLVAAQIPASVHLSASGPLNALNLQMSAQFPDLRGEPGSLNTTAQLNFAARELRLEHAEAHYHELGLRLKAPARVNFAEGLEIRGLKLGVQNTLVEIDGRVSPSLDLRASVHDVDAALINAFVPGVLDQGRIDVDAQLKGTTAAPAGLVTVKAAGLRPASSAARDLPAVDAHATVRLMQNRTQLDAHLNAGQASQLTLSGTAPLNADGTLSLELKGRLEAGLVNPLLEARGTRLAGTLAVNATVTGTARVPQVGGTVDFTNGDLRDYVQGVHLSDVTAHLVGSQGTLRVDSLTARAGPGRLSVTGEVGVLQPKLPLTLHLSATNAQPITSDILTANLNADLKVEGTLRERLDLSGTIDVNRAVIGIPNALPPEVAVLDVRRPGQAPPAPPEHPLVIGLALRLHAPREILVQGRGLDAELGGDLRIGGTTASPSVGGGFDMIRGTFTLASTQLTFSKGRVTFNGAGLKDKIDPSLDFTAQTTAADATVTLHITGLADAPQLDLSSTPSLPQDEILARLLFGESASQLTALQLAQIGAALVTLSGVGGGGPNPLARVQKALGLDRLSVGGGTSTNGTQGTQTSGATVEAGRYVSSRVFVGVKQSTTGFSQAEVDVDLSKHLKLQTRLGNGTATTQGTSPENDPGSSVGVVYQFQY